MPLRVNRGKLFPNFPAAFGHRVRAVLARGAVSRDGDACFRGRVGLLSAASKSLPLCARPCIVKHYKQTVGLSAG